MTDDRSTDLVPIELIAQIAPLGNPEEFVAGYVRISNTLSRVVREKKLYSNIQGKDHVLVEGWTLLGSMLGVFPVTVWTKPVLDAEGNQNGWEARVEARTRDGGIVGAAEAECLRSEAMWSFNPPKGKPRDDYALRSMAQTRATSKALRQPLGFVMTLAGFNATPAEEIPSEASTGPKMASRDQARRLFAIAGENSVTPERLKEILVEMTGQDSTKLIPVDRYDAIVAAVETDAIPFD